MKALYYITPLLLLLFLVGCDENLVGEDEGASFSLADPAAAKKAPVENVGNNLSFPVIWSDGVTKVLRGTFGVETFDGASFEKEGYTWYVQQDALNEWQAASQTLDPDADPELEVDLIDWGDNLEAKAWPFGAQIRVETVLYEEGLIAPMMAYTMMIEDETVSGPTETWGTNTVTYDSDEATVYSGAARLVIQRLTKDRDDPTLNLIWNGELGYWEGDVQSPVFNSGVWNAIDGPSGYSAEINVQGKVIYGYNWVTRKTNSGIGDYRITFVLDSNQGVVNLNTNFGTDTQIKPREEEEVVVAEEPDLAGGTAYVVPEDNLTYIDVRLTDSKGGGSGGGNGGGNGKGNGQGGGKGNR